MKRDPTDTITSLNFSNEEERCLLIATSWDKNMYVYTYKGTPLNEEKMEVSSISFGHPVLDSTFHHGDTSYCYAVGLDDDNPINKISLETLSYSAITGASNSVVYTKIIHNQAGNCLYTADTEKSIYVHDDRLTGPPCKYQQEISITAMCFNQRYELILAGAQNGSHMIKISDVRKLAECVKLYEHPCKSEVTSLCPVNSDGFLIGTCEGKIAMESLDNSKSLSQNYSFKCHRQETETSSLVYSVNALALKDSSVFLSGGSDRLIYGWDNKKRKKNFKSVQFPEPIAHICVNSNGNCIAIASSWLYEDGEFDISTELRHKIYVKSYDELGNSKKNIN